MGWGVQGTMKKGGGQRGINKDSSQPFVTTTEKRRTNVHTTCNKYLYLTIYLKAGLKTISRKYSGPHCEACMQPPPPPTPKHTPQNQHNHIHTHTHTVLS